MNEKLISFITVVLNDSEGLERTFLSVLNQQSSCVEHIVVDGGSTDGTLDVVKSYEQYLGAWISERDQGIYDAMNKGLKLAKGAWVCMLNAGDILEPDVIQRVIDIIKSSRQSSILFGDAYYYYPDLDQKRYVPGNSDRLFEAMSICHQAVFIPVALYNRYGNYSLEFKCAADFHFLLRLRISGEEFIHMPFPVATFFAGGISDRRVLKSRLESIRILCRLNSPKALRGTLRYIYEVVQQYVYTGLIKVLGKSHAAQIRRIISTKSL